MWTNRWQWKRFERKLAEEEEEEALQKSEMPMGSDELEGWREGVGERERNGKNEDKTYELLNGNRGQRRGGNKKAVREKERMKEGTKEKGDAGSVGFYFF